MQATTSRMRPVAAHRAVLPARDNPVVAMVVAEVVALENRARCTPLFVRTVAMRLRYLSSHVVTSLCTAAIATSHRGQAAVVTVDRAGNRHE